ncbi:MAG: cupin domain-containing protein [Saprospiraceae bacterium]|nr:cupin domain-containing protein [Saprospiraceae bacterium]
MPFINFTTQKKIIIWEGFTASFYHSDQMTFAHVSIDEGAELPEHHHIHEQWTHIVEGELMFKLGGEQKILKPGMSAFIPSNIPHSAKAITACKVIDAFLPIRQDFVELEKNA